MLRSLVSGLCFTAAVTTAGCFFTSDVNTRPVAAIEVQDPAPVHKGDPVKVNARKSLDADGDALSYTWRALSCDTVSQCGMVFATGNAAEFMFEIPDKRLVTIGLTVRDTHGAEHFTSTVLTPVNRAPTVMLQIEEGAENPTARYTIGRKLTFAASAQDPDGDPLTYEWIVDAPPASQPSQIDLQIVSDVERSFRPDVAGEWIVTLTVNDNDGGGPVSDNVPFTSEDDQAPCIAATAPPAVTGAHYILPRPDGARWFSVETVTDDLDPYPVPAGTQDEDLGGAHFRWFLAGPAAGAPYAEVSGHDLHDLLFDPTAYAPGDVLGLRVEVQDRIPRATCPVDQPTCSAAGNACLQRVSWTVEVR